MSTLSEYLRNRGLNLEPLTLEDDPILKNDDLVKEVAGLWQEHKGAIIAVIQGRANAIGKKILHEAVPEEVLVLRQALVELGAMVKDFEKYHAEQERRDKQPKEIPPETAGI